MSLGKQKSFRREGGEMEREVKEEEKTAAAAEGKKESEEE